MRFQRDELAMRRVGALLLWFFLLAVQKKEHLYKILSLKKFTNKS